MNKITDELTKHTKIGKIVRLVTSAGALSVATFSRLASLFLLTVLMGRSSGAEVLGHFSVMLAAASMLQAISVGGLSGVAIHKLLKSGAKISDELAIISTARKILIPSIFLIGIVIYLSVAGILAERIWVTLIFFAGYAFGSYDVSEIRLTAAGRFALIGQRRTIVIVVLAIPKFWAASTGYVDVAMAMQAVEAAAWQAVLVPRSGRMPRLAVPHLLRRTGHQIWFVRRLWLSGVAATFAQRVDLFVVGALLSISAAGQYSTASRPVEAAVVVAVSLVAVLFNTIVGSSDNPASYAGAVARGSRSIFAFGLGFTLVFIILGPYAIQLLYGESFAPAAEVLPLYALSLVFVFQRQFISRIIIIEEMYGLSLASNFASLIVNVSLNLWLIPVMGIHGAALAAVLTHPISLLITFLPTSQGRRILIMTYGPLLRKEKSLIPTAAALVNGR